MKFQLLGSLFLATLVVVAGCKQPSQTKKPTDASQPAGQNDNDLTQYDGFVVEKPEAFAGDFNPAGTDVGTAVGQLAPEITGRDMDGIEFKLSDYRGKVVMLDFWGDW